MTNAIHNALFFLGWFGIVALLFVGQHFARIAYRSACDFCATYVAPVLTRIDETLERHDGTLFIVGGILTLFGTLVCASSSHWIGITDLRSFVLGALALVVGIWAVVKAAD